MNVHHGRRILPYLFVLIINLGIVETAYTAEPLFTYPNVMSSSSAAGESPEQLTVDLNLQLLSQDSLQLELNFPDKTVLLKRDRFKVNKSGSKLWRGKLVETHQTASGSFEEEVGSAVLIIKQGRVNGVIHYENKTYKLEPTKSGSHLLKEVDSEAYPEEPPHHYHREIESPSEPGAQQQSTPSSAIDVSPSGQVSVSALSVIRTLVVYTPAAGSATVDIESDIDLAVASTNLSYANSDMDDSLSMELVHTAEYPYVETGNISLDLINAESDPYIQRLRDQYLADVVVVVGVSELYCGLASFINATTEKAFALVNVVCLGEGYYSFAHEIGHLQGARHDVRTDAATIPFIDGHGYIDEVNGFRTIMAYPCINDGVDECPRIPYWSNPDISYLGFPTGEEGISNNARVLAETAPAISSLWINNIPYYFLYEVDFRLHESDEPPVVNSLSTQTPSSIVSGQPMVVSEFGGFDTKNLLFDASGEPAPFDEAVRFNIREDVERLDIAMDLITQDLVGQASANGFIELNFGQPLIVSLNDSGNIQFNNQTITTFSDNTFINLVIEINFTEESLNVLVNDNNVYQQALTETSLDSFDIGISGSDQHRMALDNLTVTSNGIAASELAATFDLDNAGAWTDGQISFTAQFGNAGPHLAENLVASIEWPAEVSLDSFSSETLDCQNNNFTIVCTSAGLGANDTAEVTVVTSTADSTTQFPFSLSVNSDSKESDLDNNYKTLLLGGDGILANLEIELTGSEKTVGSRIHVTASITNYGPDPAEDIVISMPTPGSISYERSDYTGCVAADIVASRVVCGVDSLQSGESFQATLTYYSPIFFIRPTFNASVTNATDDPDLTNNNDKGKFGGVLNLLFVILLSIFSVVRFRLNAAR